MMVSSVNLNFCFRGKNPNPEERGLSGSSGFPHSGQRQIADAFPSRLACCQKLREDGEWKTKSQEKMKIL